MRVLRRGRRTPCASALLALAFSPVLLDVRGQAQPPTPSNPPAPINPLMQLMLSQPPVDLQSPVRASATFDPPVVAVGENAVYRVSLNALEASVRLLQAPVPPHGLEWTPSARGQVLHQTAKMLRPVTALNYHARAAHPGLYTVPAFPIEVQGKRVVVPKTHLEVVERLDPGHVPARALVLLPARTNVFVGERLPLRVLLPGSVSNVVETLTQLQINGEGLLENKHVLNQRVEPLEFHGRHVATWVMETSVTPFAPGRRTLTAQAFTAGLHFTGPVVLSGPATILGSPPEPLLLDSDPVTIQVRPLPTEGGANGFTGFIGRVSLDPPLLGTNWLRVGDATRLLVTFRSSEPLTRLVPPPPPDAAGWQILPPLPAAPPPSAFPPTNHVAAFAYTLIPLSEEARRTPAIPCRVFDPEQAVYLDLTIPSLDINVVAEGPPADTPPPPPVSQRRPVHRAALSDLAATPGKTADSLVPMQARAWFVPAQLLPVAAVLGVWTWARRRGFLEAHPEIVRRRRARRALRRERRALRRAAARGDEPAFTRHAVAALRIAAAPHFPAEPRALVCGDVLILFAHGERAGKTGEVIRRCFDAEARARFAPPHEPLTSLIVLRPDLEEILGQMEARL